MSDTTANVTCCEFANVTGGETASTLPAALVVEEEAEPVKVIKPLVPKDEESTPRKAANPLLSKTMEFGV